MAPLCFCSNCRDSSSLNLLVIVLEAHVIFADTVIGVLVLLAILKMYGHYAILLCLPFEEESAYCFAHVGWFVGLSVCLSVCYLLVSDQ